MAAHGAGRANTSPRETAAPTDALLAAAERLASSDAAGARAILEPLLPAHPASHELLHLLGVANREEHRYNAAHELLAAACRVHPEPVPPQYVADLASVLTGLGRHGEALPLYDAVLAVTGPGKVVSYLRGFTLEGLGRTAEAAADYETSYALSLAEGAAFAPVLAKLGTLRIAQGRPEEGLRLYRASIGGPGGAPAGEATLHPIAGSPAACSSPGNSFVEVLPAASGQAVAPLYADRPREASTPALRPASYVAELRDATVVGGVGLVVAADGTAVCDLAVHPRADRWDLRSPGLPYVDRDTALLHALPPDEPPLDAAVSLLGPASANYYHWVVEQLTRLYLVEAVPGYEDLPVLVDRAALDVPTLAASLEAATGGRRPVVPLAPRRARSVHRLVAPSPTSWGPGNLRDGLLLERGDNVLAPEPLIWLRERLGWSADRRPRRLVFISRRGGMSRLVNAPAIERMLAGMGFEAIRPETLPFDRQVELFGEARVVVGETGAGMTNLLFMHPDAQVVCLQSLPWATSVFADLAEAVGVSLTFVTGELASGSYAKTYQTPYSVDPGQVRRVVRAAMRG